MRATDMRTLKALYADFKAKRDENERAYDAWEANLEDEDLERESDDAYLAMWDSLNAFADAMEDVTDGQVTAADARNMARNPKYSRRLDALMARVA